MIDSREEAPAAASPDMFLLASDPSSAFGFGIRSTSGITVGLPGMVRGLAMALENWGTRSLAEVLAPAIDIAENGFLISSRLAGSLADGFDGGRLAIEFGNPAYDAARVLFSDGTGDPLEEGDLFVQPELAGTLTMIAENGPDAFYSGAIAGKIIETHLNARTVADPVDQAKLVGRMTLDDLANYQAKIREPVEGNYRGFRIVPMPPPSSGGLTVIQILKLIEQFPLGDEDQGFGFGSHFDPARHDRGHAPGLCRSRDLDGRHGFRRFAGQGTDRRRLHCHAGATHQGGFPASAAMTRWPAILVPSTWRRCPPLRSSR